MEKIIGIYGGKLLDRHVNGLLRLQTNRGLIIDVTPLPEDREQAEAVWGGNAVTYYLMDDGIRIFAGEHARAKYEDDYFSSLVAPA